MAKMFPDTDKTRVIFNSGAEKVFYDQCKRQLPNDWMVFYSSTLSALEEDKGLIDNEADFVLYHPKCGVIVIEVKGGRIGFDSKESRFYTINRFDERFFVKNPFQQAMVWKNRFVRQLRKGNIKVPVSYGVCFTSAFAMDIPESVGVEKTTIIGRKEMERLELSLFKMINAVQPQKYLEFQDVSKPLENLLVGMEFSTKLYIRDYIDHHEARVRDIDAMHETLVTPVAGARKLGIEGEAGTGKTLLAVLLTQALAAEHKEILLLTSNPQLNSYLARQLPEGVRVMTYIELAQTFGVELIRVPKEFSKNRNDWIQIEAPDLFRKAVEASAKRYDMILCDEAQDAQPFWWDAIKTLLNESEKSRFYVFFDRSQGIFGSGGTDNFSPEDVLPIPAPYFPLVNNYRTTREIATFARQFRTGTQVLHSHSARLGHAPHIITYKNPEDCQKKLDELVTRLTDEEKLTSDEITVLSARKPEAKVSALAEKETIGKFGVHNLQSKSGRDQIHQDGKITLSTVAGFKGLETQVGILLNVSEYNLPMNNALMSSLVYVACTRAKHLLFIFVQEDDPKREAFEDALKSIQAHGGIVIDDNFNDNECVGTVTHFDPHRMGWIAIEGEGLNKTNVMFFPHDLQIAKIEEVKLGTRLRFRPKLEGHAVIASNLKVVEGPST